MEKIEVSVKIDFDDGDLCQIYFDGIEIAYFNIAGYLDFDDVSENDMKKLLKKVFPSNPGEYKNAARALINAVSDHHMTAKNPKKNLRNVFQDFKKPQYTIPQIETIKKIRT